MINIRLLFHDICIFIRKEASDDCNVKLVQVIRKLPAVLGENTLGRRRGFYTKNIRELFQNTVKDEYAGKAARIPESAYRNALGQLNNRIGE